MNELATSCSHSVKRSVRTMNYFILERNKFKSWDQTCHYFLMQSAMDPDPIPTLYMLQNNKTRLPQICHFFSSEIQKRVCTHNICAKQIKYIYGWTLDVPCFKKNRAIELRFSNSFPFFHVRYGFWYVLCPLTTLITYRLHRTATDASNS
jgi:hypothetical protein